MKIIDRKIIYADEWEWCIEASNKEYYRNIISGEIMSSDEFEDDRYLFI